MKYHYGNRIELQRGKNKGKADNIIMLIKGIHHVCIKCSVEEVEKVREFYADILEMPVVRSWGEAGTESFGMMFDTGSGVIELFAEAKEQLPQGAIRHFALAVDDVDRCVEKVRNAGYKVTMEPNDIVIESQPPLPARIAFVTGPVGEEIEFFCE